MSSYEDGRARLEREPCRLLIEARESPSAHPELVEGQPEPDPARQGRWAIAELRVQLRTGAAAAGSAGSYPGMPGDGGSACGDTATAGMIRRSAGEFQADARSPDNAQALSYLVGNGQLPLLPIPLAQRRRNSRRLIDGGGEVIDTAFDTTLLDYARWSMVVRVTRGHCVHRFDHT
jgi:hypothetical protein